MLENEILGLNMKNVVVIGSSGAIGKAFIDSYIKDDDVENIFSFSRTGLAVEDKKLHSFFIDITYDFNVVILPYTLII